jgi:hypothetical protein
MTKRKQKKSDMNTYQMHNHFLKDVKVDKVDSEVSRVVILLYLSWAEQLSRNAGGFRLSWRYSCRSWGSDERNTLHNGTVLMSLGSY